MSGIPRCKECTHTMYEHLPNKDTFEELLRLPDTDLDNPKWPCMVCNCKTYKREE